MYQTSHYRKHGYFSERSILTYSISWITIHLTIRLNVNLLKNGRLSAGEICEHFSVTGASISRHLAILKEADLIRNQRKGKFIYYELNTSVLEDVMLWITDLKGAADDEGNDKKI